LTNKAARLSCIIQSSNEEWRGCSYGPFLISPLENRPML
jgi:hypothetical protein